MADKSGEQDIRDLYINRLLKGFADEVLVFKNYVTVSTTSAREIRWIQKTSGFLSGVTTSGMTTNIGANMSHLSQPSVVRQSFTRNTSYIREFMHETPLISDQDIKDNMVGLLAVHVRDLVRKIAYDVNTHIWNILTENQSAVNINSTTTTTVGGDQWDAASGNNIIKDLEDAKRQIRTSNYEPTHLFVSPKDYMSIVVWLVNNGAQAPSVGQSLTTGGQISTLAGLTVVVSNSVTADYAAVCAPNQAVTYYQFTGLASRNIEEPMVGIKVRAKEEGIATLTDPKAVTLIVDTQT